VIPELLAISPGDGRDLAPWIGALADAGLPGILLREPALEGPQIRELVRIAAEQIPFVAIHERNPAALRLVDEAPQICLHRRFSDTKATPAGVRFGMSCHTAEEVLRSLDAGATYVLLSPVWSPASKPHDTRAPLGQERFLEIARNRPVLALGGVTPARHRALRSAGAWGSAVLGGLFGAEGPSAAGDWVRRYLLENSSD
jgi:thiamine monophosphate synthase